MSNAEDFAAFQEQLDRDVFFVWPQMLEPEHIDEHLAAFVELNKTLDVEPNVDFHSYSAEKQTRIKEARYPGRRFTSRTRTRQFECLTAISWNSSRGCIRRLRWFCICRLLATCFTWRYGDKNCRSWLSPDFFC